MKTKVIYACHILLVVILAWSLGYSQAFGKASGQAIRNPNGTYPNPVRSAFNYQGVLKESGQPVTGVRSMAFALYETTDCTGYVWQSIGPLDVTVTNGLFNVVLNFSQAYFSEAKWMKVSVGATQVSCQELLAVPFALSLRPGAEITGVGSGDDLLSIINMGSGDALYANTFGGGAAAVDGFGSARTGYGIRGSNDYSDGVAVFSDGIFLSSADSVLELSPHSLMARGSSGLTFTAQQTGGMKIDAGAGAYLAGLPVSTFSTLFGSKFYVKSFNVCFHAVSGGKITATQMVKGDGAGGYALYINEIADHTETTRTCYSKDADTPRVAFNTASYLQFTLNYTSSSSVYIDNVELTLTEMQN